MRLSTQQIFQTGLNGMLQQQNTLNNLSEQLSTGNALNNPASNPTAYAQVLNLGSRLANLSNYQQNNQYVQQNLNQSSSTLQSVGTLLNQVQQLAVQMNNGTVNGNDLQNAVTAMQSNLQQLVQLANTQNANGKYIYGGSQDNSPPFALQSDGQVVYLGDGGTNSLQIGPSLSVPSNQPGNQIFMDVPAGNGTFTVTPSSGNYSAGSSGTVTLGAGSVLDPSAAQNAFVAQGASFQISISQGSSGMTYTVSSGTGNPPTSWSPVSSGSYTAGQSIEIPGSNGPMAQVTAQGTPGSGQTDTFTLQAAKPQSLFQTFQDIITALKAGTGSAAANTQRAQGLSNALANLSAAQTQLLSTQAAIGSQLQAAQSVSTLNTNLTQQFQSTQSSLADISYPEVITQFQESSTALQAAQKAFVQVQGLSLFQYI